MYCVCVDPCHAPLYVCRSRIYIGAAVVIPAAIMVIVTFAVALTDSALMSAFMWFHFAPVTPHLAHSAAAYRAVVRAQVRIVFSVGTAV